MAVLGGTICFQRRWMDLSMLIFFGSRERTGRLAGATRGRGPKISTHRCEQECIISQIRFWMLFGLDELKSKGGRRMGEGDGPITDWNESER